MKDQQGNFLNFLDSTARENRLPAYERVALKKREFFVYKYFSSYM